MKYMLCQERVIDYACSGHLFVRVFHVHCSLSVSVILRAQVGGSGPSSTLHCWACLLSPVLYLHCV